MYFFLSPKKALSRGILYVLLLQWVNEMELVKQTKEFKIGSIHAFSSYLVSAICKTLLNAESDAEYWIVILV